MAAGWRPREAGNAGAPPPPPIISPLSPGCGAPHPGKTARVRAHGRHGAAARGARRRLRPMPTDGRPQNGGGPRRAGHAAAPPPWRCRRRRGGAPRPPTSDASSTGAGRPWQPWPRQETTPHVPVGRPQSGHRPKPERQGALCRQHARQELFRFTAGPSFPITGPNRQRLQPSPPAPHLTSSKHRLAAHPALPPKKVSATQTPRQSMAAAAADPTHSPTCRPPPPAPP